MYNSTIKIKYKPEKKDYTSSCEHLDISIIAKPCKWCNGDIFFCGCDIPEYYKKCNKCKEII